MAVIGMALVLAFLVALVSVPACAVVVDFPDPGLEAAIRDAIDKPTGDIYESDLLGLTHLDANLDANSRNISNLEGIQYCVDLTTLDLSTPKYIVDISPLSALTNLTSLLLKGNQIVDISPLSTLSNLTHLILTQNQIVDISPLSSLTSLTSLELDGNLIVDISHLSGLISLTHLHMAWNQIVDVGPLSGLTNLTWLNLRSNQIVDISVLSCLTSLTDVYLGYNPIADIAPLAGLTGLTYLDLYSVPLVDIDALAGLTNLTNLYMGFNQISDISPVSNLTNLERLYLRNNQIADITPLLGLTNLSYLYLYSNQVADLDALVDNPGIGNGDYVSVTLNYLCLSPGSSDSEDLNELLARGVDVSYDPQLACAASFPDPGLEAAIRSTISKPAGTIFDYDLTGLEYLDATGRGIASLDGIEQCLDLKMLVLTDNQIVSIAPLSQLTNLLGLGLYNNHIVDISPLSVLTGLTDLSLDGNRIIDISALANLTGLSNLYLWGNQISDISALSGLTNLTELDLENNLITDIASLVSNKGISSGDVVDVRWNQLIIAPRSQDMLDIETLQGRGVTVTYDPQNAPADTAAVFRVDAGGFVFADQAFHALAFESGAADVAEWVHMSTPAHPGDVVEFDPIAPQQYRITQSPFSSLVAGVISTAPGITLGNELDATEKALLALVGIVPVKVTDEGGAIHAGDLLVTSSTPGHAMRWAGPDPCFCSLVGKALEPMTEETGLILVLLTAH